MSQNIYKFLDEGGQHLHLLWSERKQDYEALTGTTTIVDVLGKNLTWWSAECAAVTCLEAGECIPTIREEYLQACEAPNKKIAIDALQKKYPIFKKARFAHFDDKNEKADKGTDMHAELEEYVKNCLEENEGSPFGDYSRVSENKKILDFSKWAYENVKRFLASEANTYHEILWLGGIIDCIAELKDGTYAIIDFKSSKEAYFSQFMQCGLYDLQLAKNGAFDKNGNRILDPLQVQSYIVFPFGAKELKPAQTKKLDILKRAATHGIGLYREKSAFEKYGE